MSEIQRSILNTIPNTTKPIIIVAMQMQDADYLSLLLSNHLALFSDRMERSIKQSDNYFTNPFLQHFIAESYKKSNKDSSKILALTLEEGFDTGRLQGLALPVHLLKLLDLQRDFADATYIVVYNEFMHEKEKSTNDLYFLQTFISQHTDSCILVNAKYLISFPIQILQYLASSLHTKIVHSEKVLPYTRLRNVDLFQNSLQLQKESFRQFCIEHDQLRATLLATDADSFCFIFVVDKVGLVELLFDKINQLICIFSKKLQLQILTPSSLGSNNTQQLQKGIQSELVELEITMYDQGLAAALNKKLTTQPASYFCIDRLNATFAYSEYLPLLLEKDTKIIFPLFTIAEKQKNITLNDLLSNSIPESAIAFHQAILQTNPTFDTDQFADYLFWDFAIACSSNSMVECVAIACKPYVIESTQDEMAAVQQQRLLGYKQVIQKHHALIEKSLDEIIEAVSSGNRWTFEEQKQLHEKIVSLQLVLSHSNEELKSFHELTAQLHQRIHYLENNWYQKLRTKLGRLKKIFFKKKSPGSGSLKRILQFIRFTFSKAGFGIFRKIVKNVLKKLYLYTENRPVQIVYLDESSGEHIFTYDDWIKAKLDKSKQDIYYANKLNSLPYTPLISVVMPVYNAPIKFLKEAIESVIAQNYPNWELCIADDYSSEAKVRKILYTYAAKYPKIKVVYRSENGHISAASNSALELASGEYILLLDHDDLLARNCMAEVVLALQQHPEADILYSDEDKVEENGTHKDAHFKPDWAPDHLLSRNYIGHVVVIKKSIIDLLNGFRIGFEGSQDYDLLLRATEVSKCIVHIPKVLYHWRIHTLSAAQGEEVKPYAYIAAKKALHEAIHRRGLQGEVKYLSGLRGYKIDYALQTTEKVSIIIPTKDQTDLLKNTIDSILEKTSYPNYEIIILNNNSSTKQLQNFLDLYCEKYPDKIRAVDAHFPFNFSKLMNLGNEIATGKYLLLLNNDVEVMHANWMQTMVSYATQERIGAVGVKLLYPDDTIQHAGVVIGLGGIAGHSFVGAYKEEPGYFNYIQTVNNYSALTAACLMVRKEAFEKVDGMDEIFEVEYNDVDFCLKLLDAGYNNVYLPQVELYHYEWATRGHPHQSKVSYERHLKEMKLFKAKWQHRIDHDPFYNPNLNLGVHNFSMNFSA